MPHFVVGLFLLAANAHQSSEDRIADYTFWLMVFTAALAILGLVQMGFLMRSDKTARMSAEAAKKSATVAEEALIAGSRALVSAFRFTAWSEIDTQNKNFNWRFSAEWRNDGRTSTKNMKLYAGCELRNSPLPQGFDFTQTTSPPGPGHLGPTATAFGGRVPSSAAITPQDILDVQAMKKFLYLWGWARYHDVFPNTPERVTMFCWQIFADGDPLASDANTTMKWSSFHHSEGNSST